MMTNFKLEFKPSKYIITSISMKNENLIEEVMCTSIELVRLMILQQDFMCFEIIAAS
jgi:hypothetical protein